MSNMHIGNKEILGATYEVHADVQSGNFRIVVPAVEGESRTVSLGTSQTLAGAIAEARTELNKRKVKVAVKFRDGRGRRLTAHGLHGGSGKVMARYDADGAAEQFDTYARVFKAETPDDVMARYNEISDEVTELRREEKEIERQWKMDNIGTHVKNAIDEAVKAQAA